MGVRRGRRLHGHRVHGVLEHGGLLATDDVGVVGCDTGRARGRTVEIVEEYFYVLTREKWPAGSLVTAEGEARLHTPDTEGSVSRAVGGRGRDAGGVTSVGTIYR